MRSSLLTAAVLLLTSACLVSTGPSSSRRPPPPPPERGDHRPPPAPPPRERFLEGTITDAATGQPVGRAAIDVTSPAIQGELTTTTDASGHYRTQPLPPGEIAIRIRRDGYEVFNRTHNIVDGPARLDLQLQPKRR